MDRELSSHETRTGEPWAGNEISASINGSVLQAGAIHGDVHVRHAGGAGLVPHQLPLPTRGFVGRDGDLEWLDDHTDGIAVISGAAGIGKTALALNWAHKVRSRFPGGQLYVDLRGFGSQDAVTCSQALYGFLVSLGVAPEAIPPDLTSKAGLYRSLLDNRRVLVVLDNAKDSDQVRPLLPSGEASTALITSRHRLASLAIREGAHQISLDLLTHDDAIALLKQRVGAARVAEEGDTTTMLVERCARLPLALSIAAARAASRPLERLEALVAELSDENACLDALDLGEVDVDLRAVFSWSYRTLEAETQEAFRLFGLHTGPDIGLTAAASLMGVAVPVARHRLSRLTAAHLLEEQQPNRFTMHELLRAYAVEQAVSTDVAARHAAVRRLLDFYLHSSWAAEYQIYAHRDRVLLSPPAPGVTVISATNYAEAMAWFTTEHLVLLAAIKQAESERIHPHVWQLPWSMVTFFDRRGHWLDYTNTLKCAATAATEAEDGDALARTLRFLGRAHTVLGEFERAAECYRSALVFFEESDDIRSQAATYRGMSILCQRQTRYEDALRHGETAQKLFQRSENRVGEARILHTLAWCSTELGRFEEALIRCREAIALFGSLVPPDTQGEASAVDSYAYLLHRLGRYVEAIEHYERAVTLWTELGNQFYEANTLMRLGGAQRSANDQSGAKRSLQRAAEIFGVLNHRNASQVRSELAQLQT